MNKNGAKSLGKGDLRLLAGFLMDHAILKYHLHIQTSQSGKSNLLLMPRKTRDARPHFS